MSTSGVQSTPEITAQARDQFRWKNYRRHLKIEDRRTGMLIPFQPNVIQQRISDAIDEKIRARLPIRLIILKSRRMGVSTIIQARFAHLVFTQQRWSAITGAHQQVSSGYLHGMVEQMYNALPAPLQRTKAVGLQGRRLMFVEGSELRTFTAGSEAVGRGTGWRGIHASEVAFWDDASGTLLDLRQTVPNEPGTIVALESTANGMKSVFRDEWVRAIEGRSEYVPLFFAWYEFPDYQMELTDRIPGCDHGRLDPDWWHSEDYPDGSVEEEDVLRGLGCTEEQLAWRRFTLVNECGEDLDKFHQEYPSTAEEAFLASGHPFFPPVVQARLAKVTHDPQGRGDISGEPLQNGRLAFVPSKRGPLHVFEAPRTGPYLIGADSAGGISDDERQARERGEGDYNAACVVDLSTGRAVADWQKRTDADLFARDLARLGWMYRTPDGLPAKIAVESNNMGLLTLSKLRDEWYYPRIFHRQALSHEYRGRGTRTIGWVTGAGNRGAILAGLLEVARDRPDMLPSRRLLDQIRTFIQVDERRYEHAPGAHDDLVFAYAITYFLFHLESHFPFAQPGPDEGPPTSVQDLEAFALGFRNTGGPPASIRAIALARPPRR